MLGGGPGDAVGARVPGGEQLGVHGVQGPALRVGGGVAPADVQPQRSRVVVHAVRVSAMLYLLRILEPVLSGRLIRHVAASVARKMYEAAKQWK